MQLDDTRAQYGPILGNYATDLRCTGRYLLLRALDDLQHLLQRTFPHLQSLRNLLPFKLPESSRCRTYYN